MKKVLVYMLKLMEIESKGDERRWMRAVSPLFMNVPNLPLRTVFEATRFEWYVAPPLL